MHHISDVDTWGNPDRNYYVFVVISVLLGFIGIDHFYLRSFGTGTQKLFVNIFTLGFWYWWDLIQVFREGQKIRTEGLSSPLDWIQGIGRGVFTQLPSDKDAQEQTTQSGGSNADKTPVAQTFAPKKSYILYTFLAVFFGWLGADKFYLGEMWQGLAKVLSCFNIFLFLFGWLWVVWDAVHAFFMTDSIMKNGISAPMPYSFVFHHKTCPSIFKVKSIDPNAPVGEFGLFDWLLPNVPQGFSLRTIYRELLAPLMIPPVVQGLKELKNPSMSLAMPAMPAVELPSLSAALNSAKEAVETQTHAATESFKDTLDNATAPIHMRGGGAQEGGGPGPVIAGALTAVVLAGGLKGFYDFIVKQYG